MAGLDYNSPKTTVDLQSRKDAERWFVAAQYDLETAEAMLRAGRYLYVLFCCQQVTEKHLKGLVVARTGQMPPKLHDLLRLSEFAGVHNASAEQRLLADLNGYYVETRYPEEVTGLAAQLSSETAEECLKNVRGYLGWLDRTQK